jgi:hypothetical protein
MAPSLDIRRLRARYRVAAGETAGVKDRLDRVLRRVLDGALDDALAAAGVAEGEEICVRAVDVAIRLDAGEPDGPLAELWSAAIAAALRDAIASGRGVVRYRSRAHALVDVVSSAVAGDLGRAWAWRQLGLWDGPDEAGSARAAEGALRALARMPEAAPAALAAVAARDRAAIERLARRAPAAEWIAVARRALAAAGVEPRVLAPSGSPAVNADAAAAGPRLREWARRIVARAPFAIPLAAVAAGRAGATADAGEAARAAGASEATRAAGALAALAAEPDALRRGGAPLLDAVVAQLAARLTTGDRDGSPSVRPERSASAGGAESRGRDGERADEAHPLPGPRPVGRTRAGGLLYLLHLVADLGLEGSLCAEDGPLAARPLRWALHALALALLPIEPRDPAALAFCGLAPGDDPPSDGGARASTPACDPRSARTDERVSSPAAPQRGSARAELAEPFDEREQAALEAAAERIALELRRRLRREDEPAQAMLLATCRRDAEIVADPGWIEVRYALDDVDVGVRRAGLDLDPGWLPWLGCVVRFTYA